MPIKNRWTIPDDYSDTDTPWVLVTLCIPNTRKWRGIITGLIYTLTRGRHWDETTGIIKVAQVIGRRIFGSMSMDCNNDFGRMADALEALNEKFPELKTLDEVLADLGASELGDLADLTRILAWVQDLFPNLIPKLPVGDWFAMFTGWRRHRETMFQFSEANESLRILAVAETGETGVEIVDEATDNIWAALEGIITTAGAAGDLLSGLGVIGELFRGILEGYESDDPDNDERLRALVNVVLENEGMMVSQVNTQTVNCGGGGGIAGCSGSQIGSAWVPDETPTGSAVDDTDYNSEGGASYPTGFDSKADWDAYRCKAANAMYYEIGEQLYQFYDLKNAGVTGGTVTLTISNTTEWLLSVKAGVIAAIKSRQENFAEILAGWLGEMLGVPIFVGDADDEFPAFLDIRAALLDDRENVVCALYNAASSGEAREAIMSLVADYFDALSHPADVEEYTTEIIRDVLANHYLGRLFENDDTYAGFSDSGAIDCLLCSDYIYPTGTCSTTYSSDNNSADGDGAPDDNWAGSYPYTSWECQLDTPLIVNEGMSVGVFWRTDSGPYHKWYLFATIDGVEYTIGSSAYQSSPGGWSDKSLPADQVGGTLQSVRFRSTDSGFGPDHWHSIDGLRVGGYSP